MLHFLSVTAQAQVTTARLLVDPLTSLQARLQSIENSKVNISIEAFYLENDSIGGLILDQLSRQKLQYPQLNIRIVTDAWGSASMPIENICYWQKKGIQWKQFNPQSGLGSLISQSRTHRKIWITDNSFIVGGRNLADEHFEQNKLDWDIEVRGDLKLKVQNSFDEMWHQAVPILCANGIENQGPNPIKNPKTLGQWIPKALPMPTWSPAKLKWISETINKKYTVNLEILNSLAKVKKSLLLDNAFFIPPTDIQNSLLKLASKGIPIKMLLNGLKQKLPTMGQYTQCLSMSYQEEMIANKIKIFHPRSESTHGKAFLIDDKILGIGSFNLDYRSAFWNSETLLLVEDAPQIVEEFKIAWLARTEKMQSITTAESLWTQDGFSKEEIDSCKSIENKSALLKWFF